MGLWISQQIKNCSNTDDNQMFSAGTLSHTPSFSTKLPLPPVLPRSLGNGPDPGLCLPWTFFLCLDKLAESAKARWQNGQMQGFSNVWWMRRWIVSVLARMNDEPQSAHRNGFSPVIEVMCQTAATIKSKMMGISWKKRFWWQVS